MTNLMLWDVDIKIGDFGQCGKRGGTPGWTAPQFLAEREPGKGDMYSTGLMVLYLLVEDVDVFYCLRDNYIEDTSQTWLANFRNMPEIEFVMKMISLKKQPTVAEVKQDWIKLKSNVNLITRSRLSDVPSNLLTLQHQLNTSGNLSGEISILEEALGKAGISLTSDTTLTDFTRTHKQGKTEFCWLYSVSTSVKKSMLVKTDSLPPGDVKTKALAFLQRSDLHQILRKEILFGLIPKTVQASPNQQHGIVHLMKVLENGSFLHESTGLMRLESINKFANIIKPSGLTFTMVVEKVDEFMLKKNKHWPIILLEGLNPDNSSCCHVVVLKSDQPIKNGKITVRNSLAGETVFGKVQASEHEVECKMTKITNQWNLLVNLCVYIELA